MQTAVTVGYVTHGLELHAYLIKEINDREKKEDGK